MITLRILCILFYLSQIASTMSEYDANNASLWNLTTAEPSIQPTSFMYISLSPTANQSYASNTSDTNSTLEPSTNPTSIPSIMLTPLPSFNPTPQPSAYPTINPTAAAAIQGISSRSSDSSETILLVTILSFSMALVIVLAAKFYKHTQSKAATLAAVKRSYRGGHRGHLRRNIGNRGGGHDDDDNNSIASDTSNARLLTKDRSKVLDQGWQVSYVNEEYVDLPAPKISTNKAKVQPDSYGEWDHRPSRETIDPEEQVWSPNIHHDRQKYRRDNPYEDDDSETFSITL
jgi:hypothetical protein